MDYAKEINMMVTRDQKLRKRLDNQESDNLWKKIKKLDNKNTAKLKEIIKTLGLPSISKVGRKASYNSWLLVQHSPDLDFQKKYLRLMEKNKSDVDIKNIVHLKDRILMYEGKKQIYGTQVVYDDTLQKYELYKVKKPKELNKRRKETGLEPIEEYLDSFK